MKIKDFRKSGFNGYEWEKKIRKTKFYNDENYQNFNEFVLKRRLNGLRNMLLSDSCTTIEILYFTQEILGYIVCYLDTGVQNSTKREELRDLQAFIWSLKNHLEFYTITTKDKSFEYGITRQAGLDDEITVEIEERGLEVL